jgi:hypothetical protein
VTPSSDDSSVLVNASDARKQFNHMVNHLWILVRVKVIQDTALFVIRMVTQLIGVIRNMAIQMFDQILVWIWWNSDGGDTSLTANGNTEMVAASLCAIVYLKRSMINLLLCFSKQTWFPQLPLTLALVQTTFTPPLLLNQVWNLTIPIYLPFIV